MSLEKITKRIPLILFGIFVVIFFLSLYLDLSWTIRLDPAICVGYMSSPYAECSFELDFLSLVFILELGAFVLTVFAVIFLFVKRVFKSRFLSK